MRNNNPILGATYLLRGLRLLTEPGLRRYVVAPLLINAVLFALGIWLAVLGIDRLLADLLPAWLDWLDWLLWPLLVLVFAVVVFFTFSIVANLVAAPFNGFLSAAIERMRTGVDPVAGMSLKQEVAQTLSSEAAKLWYTVVRAGPLLLLTLVPGLNVLGTPLWLLFSAWMQSLQHVDYPMGNHGIGFTRQRRMHAEVRWLSLGFGGAVTLAMLVPVLNFLVMPAAVAGATLMWLDHMRPPREELQHA